MREAIDGDVRDGGAPWKAVLDDARRASAIVRANARRAGGDRRLLFAALVVPLAVILLVGIVFGSATRAPIGVVVADRGPLATAFVSLLEHSDALRLTFYSAEATASLRDDVLRGKQVAALVVPAGFDTALREGAPVPLDWTAEPSQAQAAEARAEVVAAADVVAAEATAAALAARNTGTPFVVALRHVERLTETAYRAALERHHANPLSPYSYTTPANLVLFVFIALLGTSAGIVESRQLGVVRRMLATPTRPRALVAGQVASFVGVGVGQAVSLLLLGRVLFGVRWGNPVGVGLVVAGVVLAASGAGVLLGTLARSQEQAVALGSVAAIATGMLGGCMWPLDVVGPLMRAVGHATPQAWAMDAFVRLVFGHAGLKTVLPDVVVLAGFAVALMGLATWRLQRMVAAGA